jgi:hypothetical protein
MACRITDWLHHLLYYLNIRQLRQLDTHLNPVLFPIPTRTNMAYKMMKWITLLCSIMLQQIQGSVYLNKARQHQRDISYRTEVMWE